MYRYFTLNLQKGIRIEFENIIYFQLFFLPHLLTAHTTVFNRTQRRNNDLILSQFPKVFGHETLCLRIYHRINVWDLT